jgi:hypothetical protein
VDGGTGDGTDVGRSGRLRSRARGREAACRYALALPSGAAGRGCGRPFHGIGDHAPSRQGRRAPGGGVEVDERYCEVAAKRLAQGVLAFGEMGWEQARCDPLNNASSRVTDIVGLLGANGRE